MAPGTGKKRTAKSTPNKNTSKKSTANTKKKTAPRKKRRSKKRSKKSNGFLKVVLILLAVLLLVGAGYCLGTCWQKTESMPKKEHTKTVKTHREKPVKKSTKPKEKSHPVKAKPQAKPVREPITVQPFAKHVKLAYRGERPRLVIIIDDVHTQQQLHDIGHIGYPVTPSIFPPYSLSPHTPRLARNAVHYMIHLPMESGSAKFNTQSKTLMSGFSKEQMETRMKELRRLFPRAHFINNHTGSVFTANEAAMNRLYEAMRKEGFIFIDSRTSAKSKVGKIAHAHGDAYVARDIFLDNIQSVPAIRNQLKKAVRLAKKNGYAIAIGHPHKATIAALKSAAPLLKDVDVVYVDEIFRVECLQSLFTA